jgi:hypothetical protein
MSGERMYTQAINLLKLVLEEAVKQGDELKIHKCKKQLKEVETQYKLFKRGI